MRNKFGIVLLSLLSLQAYGLEVKTLADNQTSLTKISAKEPTKIFVENDRIRKADGPEGAYDKIQYDAKTGEIFIKPSMAYQNKSFSLTIQTEQGHSYVLFLVPIDVPSQVIEIKPKSPVKKVAEHWEKNSAYSQLLIQLISSMMQGENPEGYAVLQGGATDKTTAYGDRLTMQLKTASNGSHLKGEVLQIKLVDHVIVGADGRSFSFREAGYLV
jgi:type-F conjugative transfer system secretin TraK